MSQRPRDREIPEEHRAQEHLANERTFLAWVRTTIALISLGFVLTRLGPWLSEAGTSRALSRASPIGIGLIVLGALRYWRRGVMTRSIVKSNLVA